MLLSGKRIVIMGGSGAIGTAMAKAFAVEGAKVYLGARGSHGLAAAAEAVRSTGGIAEAFSVDCLDEDATRRAVEALAERLDEIDVAINATSFMHDQGTFIDGLDLDTFMSPIDNFLRSLFNSTKAVVPYMGKSRQGVILTLSTPAGRAATPGHLGYSVTCAGVEAFSRVLAAELGMRNIRVVCLGPHAISDAPQAGSYTAELFAPKAEAMGLSVEQWLGGGAQSTLLGRLPTLDDVAQTAAFLVSDKARSMTAAYVNLTAGMIPD
ncbi:SDR family NAD(P)-dependent oxidoreductase [Pleomorphomonas sp. PLEO]|uniref:SDR family NAD(P)-dependent oxidoreductase n=1 Tax=Pleomorphomonas sp. PLEO TaxID=3239306 RepID=UPI00351E3836